MPQLLQGMGNNNASVPQNNGGAFQQMLSQIFGNTTNNIQQQWGNGPTSPFTNSPAGMQINGFGGQY